MQATIQGLPLREVCSAIRDYPQRKGGSMTLDISQDHPCRNCGRSLYFGGIYWWHRNNESSFCYKSDPFSKRADPYQDKDANLLAAAPALLEALRMFVATGTPVGTFGDLAYAKGIAAIAQVDQEIL
jgi:hypothetical protein